MSLGTRFYKWPIKIITIESDINIGFHFTHMRKKFLQRAQLSNEFEIVKKYLILYVKDCEVALIFRLGSIFERLNIFTNNLYYYNEGIALPSNM